MFRATSCSSSEESIVSIQYLVYVTLSMTVSCAGRKGTSFLSDLHTKRSSTRVTYTRYCIDTIDSSDDEHEVVRNMWRIKVNA